MYEICLQITLFVMAIYIVFCRNSVCCVQNIYIFFHCRSRLRLYCQMAHISQSFINLLSIHIRELNGFGHFQLTNLATDEDVQ